MVNWFPIGKHVDFNLIYPLVGTVRWPINQPFQYLLWLKAQGVEFFSQVHDAGVKSIFEHHRIWADQNSIWLLAHQLIAAVFLLMVLRWF